MIVDVNRNEEEVKGEEKDERPIAGTTPSQWLHERINAERHGTLRDARAPRPGSPKASKRDERPAQTPRSATADDDQPRSPSRASHVRNILGTAPANGPDAHAGHVGSHGPDAAAPAGHDAHDGAAQGTTPVENHGGADLHAVREAHEPDCFLPAGPLPPRGLLLPIRHDRPSSEIQQEEEEQGQGRRRLVQLWHIQAPGAPERAGLLLLHQTGGQV